MSIGMLWFDNDPKATLEDKVRRAAAYYQRKYGDKPNTCFTHPVHVKEGQVPVDDIAIRPSPSILPNHFWIGIESEA